MITINQMLKRCTKRPDMAGEKCNLKISEDKFLPTHRILISRVYSNLIWSGAQPESPVSAAMDNALPKPKENLRALCWIWLTLGHSLKAQKWALNSIAGVIVASNFGKIEWGNPPFGLGFDN